MLMCIRYELEEHQLEWCHAVYYYIAADLN